MREHLGVAGEDVSGGMQRFLVQRSGADRLDVAGHCQFGGHADVFVGGVACHSRQFAPGQVLGKQPQIDDVDPPGVLGVGDPFDGNDLRLQAENAAASRSRAASPMTTGGTIVATCGSSIAGTMTSGPIPAPSPMVTAT